MNLESELGAINPFFTIAFVIWLMFWKSIALWRAAKASQINWFIVILILNSLTFGVLEIIYLFIFAKPKMTLGDLKKMNLLPRR